jgi:hypothetical protein
MPGFITQLYFIRLPMGKKIQGIASLPFRTFCTAKVQKHIGLQWR